MPGSFEEVAAEVVGGHGFSVLSQKVDLDIDLATRSLSGTTQIVAQPHSRDLKAFRLNCRQGKILRATIEGRPAPISYADPYEKIKFRRAGTTIHQHGYLKDKVEPYVKGKVDSELSLSLPTRVVIKELEGDGTTGATRPTSLQRRESEAAETPTLQSMQEQASKYAPLKIYIEFQVQTFRDGLHFAGFEDGDNRYPHVYTKNNLFPGTTCSLFPCLDDANSRCMWEISIRCARTLGDAFRRPDLSLDSGIDGVAPNEDLEQPQLPNRTSKPSQFLIDLAEEDSLLDLAVICSGEMTDDIVDEADPTRRTVSFACATPVAARHIGFAIGPFEHIELSAEFREVDEDDRLGHSAIKIHGYCLPGRADEVRNTCMPMPKAIDYFTVTYGSYPFMSYTVCFVDDMFTDFADTAGLSICSARLLFPETVLEPLDSNTRILVQALANQYSGINIIPRESTDMWIVTGISGFMTDAFMRKLAGNNEFRFRQKLATDKVYDLDVGRYSIHQLGDQLDIDPTELDFLRLKSALVLFILDRRLTKASGSAGMSRIITRVFLNSKTGDLDNGEIATEYFLRTCEKLGHTRLDSFFKQWVYGAGCPEFRVNQRFNKKKLVVEMTIQQGQLDRTEKPQLQPSTFLREAKEQVAEAWVPPIQPVFTGPMTIRIHEADGTPYEHIVEIKEATTKIEIPYNTKYKRLKRSKRAKERAIANNGPEQAGENHDDVLLYCLGDTLQSEQEVSDWKLADWSESQEAQMGGESYEWIRMDADFEWIAKTNLNMPIYMYVSQLQQDRDVVAQYESLQRIVAQEAHPIGSTILIRTLMDRRYFHGIRTFAAHGLAKCAIPQLDYLGQYHLEKAFQDFFCVPDTSVPRANDFSDRASYLLQSAIPKALAKVRDANGSVPISVRRFFIDKIKFNDNTMNEFSDCFYMAMLMKCLAECIATTSSSRNNYSFHFNNDDEHDDDSEEQQLKREALIEIERYRRIDEWISSYQNTYTITAIQCIERLLQSGAIKDRAADILQYTRAGNADNVRLQSFTALVGLKLARKSQIMKYILHSLAEEQSPYLKSSLVQIFGQALGSKAIGDDQAETLPRPAVEVDAGLILEQEAPAEARQVEIARKTSPEGALNALRDLVAHDDVLKSALWQAVQSPTFTLSEVASLLDVAGLLFETSEVKESLPLTLRLPRKYKVLHVGQGKLRFTQTGALRIRPSQHSPLSAQDWALFQEHELKYTGPVVKEVKERKTDKKAADDLNARLAIVTENLQKQEQLQAQKKGGHMSPPAARTPATESAPVKLSLKRKQSVDLGRAGSPKVQKTQKAQTANGSTITPAPTRSPSVVKQRSITPATSLSGPSRAAKPVKAKSKLVKLNTQRVRDRVDEILSTPPRRTLSLAAARRASQTPAATPVTAASPATDGYFPQQSPQSEGGLFSKKHMQGWNTGGFRSFGSAGQAPGRIKIEDTDSVAGPASGISPKTAWPPMSSHEKSMQDDDHKPNNPAEPPRKGIVKLKLGKKA